ncbi:ribosomal protein L7/L12 [Glycomyces luteolus]|uniref:Ribosomal protein L7/L12 n=1 Tax=Glycomyces luteolus TaxID=2670330 RepID=A0A9X3P7E9_9ACTN|nr:ribosomal protein L7/L12 [Glycomyces luteolus]MDA1360126.1 ribosomal protein L7/L12 [Glycomyces luteolus]
MRDRHDLTLQALARIERKLDLVMQHLEIRDYAPPEPDPFGGVRDLVRQGRKIQAIKAYREITGVGLKEAKDAVERMEAGR